MPAERIVLGLDGSRGAQAAAQWCAAHAGRLDAEVVAVHAIPPVVVGSLPVPGIELSMGATARAALCDALQQWCAPLHDAGVRFDTRIVDGDPAAAITELADEVDAVMVVVGRRGRGGFAELLLGSVPHRLTHHCNHPVLVVPAR
jgi:nucleotide-binding universal stress UspA family protein